MTKDDLQKLFEEYQCRELAWEGKCHDCGADVVVVIRVEDDGKLIVSGGALYNPVVDDKNNRQTFVKCDACLQRDSVLREYRPIDVYQRIVGYYTPVKQWNPGKKSEFNQRVSFMSVEG